MKYEDVVSKQMLWMRRKATWRLQDLGVFWLLAGCAVAVIPALPYRVAWGLALCVVLVPHVRLKLADFKIRKYRNLEQELRGFTKEDSQ